MGTDNGSRLSRSWLRLLFGVLCLGAIALVAAGCGGDDDDEGGGDGGSAEAPQEIEEVTMTFPFQDSIIWSGYEISRGPEGPFEVDAGLRPETQAVEGNSQTIQQLVSGQVDYAVTGVPEIFVANARGNEVIGLSQWYDDVFTIVATDESGTQSIEDLEGQAIGVTDLGGGEIPLVNAVLSNAGLEPGEDVQLEVVGPGGATAFRALRDGDVAAFGGAINDLVPLEQQGLNFVEILPEEYKGLPVDITTVPAEVLEDEETIDMLTRFMKAVHTGVLFGEQYPEAGLERICEQVPEDCQDRAFAEGFYESAVGIAVAAAERGGCPDYEALETVRDSVAAVDAPAASEIDPRDIFPDTYCQDMVPSEEDVQAFAERVGVAGEGTE